MIVIELLPTSVECQPGEGLTVEVRLRSVGKEAEVANPAALRAAPRWRLIQLPEGTEYVAGNEQGYAPPPGQPERLRLATGDGWNGTVIFKSANVPLTPGSWAISLLLPVDGVVEESPPCIIRVADWAIAAADAGWGVPGEDEHYGDTLMLQQAAGAKPGLYRMGWRDDDSDRTGTGAETPIPLGNVGFNATDPLVPVRDGPFWMDTAQWFLWREGAAIIARSMIGECQELTLSEAPAALLRPALQRLEDDILVLALSADRRQLMRLRFSHDNSKQPECTEAINLPLAATGGTAAFAPDGTVLVGLSAGTPGGGCALVLIGRGGLATPRVATWSGVALVPGAQIGLTLDQDGAVRLGALVAGGDGIFLLEARFPLELDGVPGVGLLPLAGMGTEPVGGAVLYGPPQPDDQASEDETANNGAAHKIEPSRHVVIHLADDTFLRLGASGSLEAVTYEATPVPPFCLVNSGHGALLLVCDPRLGPYMTDA